MQFHKQYTLDINQAEILQQDRKHIFPKPGKYVYFRVKSLYVSENGKQTVSVLLH